MSIVTCRHLLHGEAVKQRRFVVLEMLLAMMKEIAECDDFFDTMALCMKKSYDSLVKAGFSEEQAMRILVAHGLGAQAKSK